MKNIVNPKDIDQLIITDGMFAFINDTYGPPPDWTRPQGFMSLSRIILGQQVSLASADAHFFKLNRYIVDFTPVNILALSHEEMKNCQISRQKSKYLRALSSAVLENRLNLSELENLEPGNGKTQLTRIKGIGSWTADAYLMFCLKAKDIFPFGDIALVNTVSQLYNTQTRKELMLLAEKWKPLRSLASYYFWHQYLKSRNR